jgi:hypothetical protein
MISASFDSTKTHLQELLARADNASLQLPDFQGGWVWDDDRIRSLAYDEGPEEWNTEEPLEEAAS